QRKSVWIKGHLVFAQSAPESLPFSCVQFDDVNKENIHHIHEIVSQAQNLLVQECFDMELRAREVQAELTKAGDSARFEKEKRERAERIIQEVGEHLGYLSTLLSGTRGENWKMPVREAEQRIDALLSAMAERLNQIRSAARDARIVDSSSFERNVSVLGEELTDIRKHLHDLASAVSDEFGILAILGRQFKELQDVLLCPPQPNKDAVP
ncbi:MAG TPA: hypothetical protein VLS90_13055, partial [Thermodesulfobacteriota bacterium]|nr:hypothetical protein [Thermodesulfobacteriota bacterium]